jgi:hypothetical protein
MAQVVQHFRARAQSNAKAYQNRKMDYKRLERIELLNPAKCYTGVERRDGYVVFEFDETRSVVLECAFAGNATYVLSDRWKQIVVHSKSYIRLNYPGQFVRVFHTENWLARVRAALQVLSQ